MSKEKAHTTCNIIMSFFCGPVSCAWCCVFRISEVFRESYVFRAMSLGRVIRVCLIMHICVLWAQAASFFCTQCSFFLLRPMELDPHKVFYGQLNVDLIKWQMEDWLQSRGTCGPLRKSLLSIRGLLSLGVYVECMFSLCVVHC